MKISLALKLDALLDPLAPAQLEGIRSAFRKARRPAEAALLIADWVRIAETAHQHALKTEMRTNNILLLPSVRNRRDRQLRHAVAALNRSVEALNEAAGLLEKHPFMDYYALQQHRAFIQAALVRLRDDAERYRLHALTLPKASNRSGNTLRWIPDRCLGEVLAAYFRHKGWPISTIRTGLFSTVANAVLSRRAINDQTLRRLSAFSTEYTQLEAAAPHNVKPAMPAPIARRERAIRGSGQHRT